MNIWIECPLCGFHKEVSDRFAGKEVKCPHCETTFNAPQPAVKVKRASALPAKPNSAPAEAARPPKIDQPRQRSRWPLVVGAVVVVILGAAGTVAFLVLPRGSAQVGESQQAPVVAPPSHDAAAEEARRIAEKKATEEKAERDRLAALAKAEDERKAKELAEKERIQKEQERLAREEKLERERQERLAREEKERKEREAKEEAARLAQERRNPKLAATPEEVDAAPDKFIGKRLYFDDVRLKANSIDRAKDPNVYTLGLTSKGGHFYSRVVLGGIFFSAGDQLVEKLQKDFSLVDRFPHVRLYCEIRAFEKKAGAKPLPQAHIFKIEIYNLEGGVVKTWEEPE